MGHFYKEGIKAEDLLPEAIRAQQRANAIKDARAHGMTGELQAEWLRDEATTDERYMLSVWEVTQA